MISKKDFYRFIKQYKPLPNQFMADHSWRKLKKKPMHYALFGRVRFYQTLRTALKYIHTTSPVILDIGVYPGTLLCILSDLLKRYNYSPTFYGVGLSLSQEFINNMESRTGATIKAVNIDPANTDLIDKGYPDRIPFDDDSFDMVFATEIIEHLNNPRHMLAEAQRVLKRKGVLIITTPNVSRIGSIFKLLIGRSNLDTLSPVGYSNAADEWRPHFREYSMGELISLLEEARFKIAGSKYFIEKTEFIEKSIMQKLIDFAKTFFEIIPFYRGSILIVAEK